MRARALVLALALAACAPPAPSTETPMDAPEASALASMPSWEGARAAGVDFRGVGQEPGWMIDIHQENRIVLLLDYGESIAEFPLTEPQYPQEGATLYQTSSGSRTLVVTISRSPCQDSMSGEAFPATVEVAIDGRTLNGCGRTV